DHVFQALQLADDQRAMRPGTGQRHVEVVAARRGSEVARAVGADPAAEGAVLADEAAARVGRVIPLVVPLPVDEESHPRDLREPGSLPARPWCPVGKNRCGQYWESGQKYWMS